MRSILPALFLTLFIAQPAATAASPLRYHTFAEAVVDARVESIEQVSAFLPGRAPMAADSAPRADSVQMIRLSVLKVHAFQAHHTSIPSLRAGEIVEITNPFLDQVPPFKPGDQIFARLRLVLPEETYQADHPRRQWWLAPGSDGEEAVSPPRKPFLGIIVY